MQLRRAVGNERQQVKYVLLGITGGSVFALTTDLILPLLGFEKLANAGSLGAIILSSSIAYGIVKYQLFNIKVLLTETAVTLVLLGLVTQTLSDPGGIAPTRLALILLLGYGGWILVKSVRDEVSRREEVENLAKEKIQTLKELEQRNKNLGTLQRISDIVLQEIELRPMVQKILDEIPVQMDTAVGALVTLVQNGKLEAYTFSANEFSRKINALVGPDLSKYAYPMHKNYNKLHDALLERVVHESSNLADFVSPPLPKTMAVMLQKLIGAKYCLALPLYVGKENLGVMLFVFKVTKDQLNSKDLEMAQAIANDTTLAIERSQAFQKLKDANEYLSQLDKMKDEFISVASHELNTPLAAIEGYLSMILDEGMGKIDDKSRMYLGRAYDSSKRLAELILDLLNTSRIEQGRLKMKYSEVNLAELTQSVIHELQIKADGKKIYLKMEAPKVVPLLWCDPDRIREVIVNLTGNAIKFTEKGGVTIKIEQPDHTLRVSVIDTGRGIDKVDQNKLFQKFSQVKREVDEHQGTGLGLYISKSFIDLHKGRLWVESEAGKGASFIFELPIIDKPPKEVPGAILESTFGSPRIEVGNKEAPAIIAASSKKSS
jgi:signal transduction histidine kinase